MPTPKQKANLKPIRRGEVRNPSGRNQYSYRRDFEAAIGQLAAGRYDGHPQACTDQELECTFCGLRGCRLLAAGIGPLHDDCLEDVRQMTFGEVLAHITLRKALAGDPKVLQETLRRFWPDRERDERRVDESLSDQLDRALRQI
jgi:hypothetical protein